MHLTQNIQTWLDKRETNNSHRQLLVISGERSWTKKCLQEVLEYQTQKSQVCLSTDTSIGDITNQSFKTVLGSEFQLVIYDAHDGIRANALIAISGCVSRSGLMIMLCPNLGSWHNQKNAQQRLRTSYGYRDDLQASVFAQWLVNHIQHDSTVSLLSEQQTSLKYAQALNEEKILHRSLCKTYEQQQAVDGIINQTSKDNSQTLITANRGRGKSSALGIAAAKIIVSSGTKIVVTAAHKSMTNEIFVQMRRVLTHLCSNESQIEEAMSRINFRPFDALLSEDAEILFIDEAATIPNSVLQTLVNRFAHTIFSTTVHGYEGSGRGFELRFKPYLCRNFETFKQFFMEQPTRWQQGDALESFWFDVMAMSRFNIGKKASTKVARNTPTATQCKTRELAPLSLITDTELLSDVFQLLVDAHYQTSPDDLLRLLDAPDLKIHATFSADDKLLAVAICIIEGGEILDDVAAGVAKGTRRLPGHLTAQRLAFEYAEPSFAARRYYRIVRIAVADPYRCCGVGSQLVDYIRQYASKSGYDYLSTSYGLTAELLKFWQKNGLAMVKVGLKKDASSGEYSVLMLDALSTCSETTSELSLFRYLGVHQFKFHSGKRLKALADSIKTSLLENQENLPKPTQTSAFVNSMTEQFVEGNRPLYSAEWAIYQLIKTSSQLANNIYLRDLLVYQLEDHELISKYKLTGKKQIEQQARFELANLIHSLNVGK